MPCSRFVVGGKVQGVWFRASTRAEAERLGLAGHAVNLANGDVEVVACGDRAALDRLRQWLWQGPDLARVTRVDEQPLAERSMSGFSTG